jgi:hypothetical protein
MIRNALAVMALVFCTASFAAQTNIDTTGLSDAQVAELKAHAAKVVADAAKPAADNPGAVMTLAATWGQQAAQAAEGFARAISLAAKELGVTVNEFLKTDAGKLTAALIIWKVAGAAIVKMLWAMLFMVVGQVIARVIYKRLFTKEYKSVEYSYFGGLFKGTKLVRVPKTIAELHGDGEWLMLWIMIAASLGSLLIGLIAL